MAYVTRIWLVAGLVSLLMAGCLPTGSTTGGDGESDEPSRQSSSSEDAGDDEDATSSEDSGPSTEDTGQATNDTGQATSDTGQTTEDTSTAADTSTSQDTGNPQQNPCENGPLDAPIEGCSPTPLPSTGDPREDCVRRINQFRWECQCLPPLDRWHDGEQCADEQAAYDAQNNSPHAGFSEGICSPRGRAQNECPGWGSWDSVIGGCLQQMWDEGPGEPFSEHGHYINMSSSQYTKVACGSGDGWFVQNFR